MKTIVQMAEESNLMSIDIPMGDVRLFAALVAERCAALADERGRAADPDSYIVTEVMDLLAEDIRAEFPKP